MRTFLSFVALGLLSCIMIFCVGCFYNYFYPLRYCEQIVQAGKQTNIEAALVASIINVESGFREDAVSNKGAVGLMQIMPETAMWVCKKMGQPNENLDLTDVETNINIGCEYLRMLLNTFSNEEVAICAYNAGPNKVKTWLDNASYSADGVTLSKIPYKETSEYLNKVKKNLRYYSKKYAKFV